VLVGVGDLDGDGRDDVVLGAPAADGEPTADTDHVATARGAAFVVAWEPPPGGRAPLAGPLAPAGLGDVRVGMSVGAVEDLLGGEADFAVGGGQCGYLRSPDARVSVMVNEGTVARVDVTGRGFASERGIEVGYPIGAVREAYGVGLDERPSPYQPDDPELYVDTPDGRMLFGTDDGEVSRIHAGRVREVDFPEGCA
jgi:hypothetical protein